jgi:hypothetical protein
MTKPALSILIPWYQRDELLLTLAANAPVFRALGAEILVLNCGGNSERLRHLITASEVTAVRQLDIFAPRFNKALALNVGLLHSRSDTIFTLDADVALLGDALAEAKALTEDHSFVTIEWVYESEPANPVDPKQQGIVDDFAAALVSSATLELHFRDGATVQHQLSRRDFFGNKRAGPGLLLAAKRDLLAIHGFNSIIQGWGWEDDDVLVRLQYVLKLRRVQKGEALHLTHGDDRRMLYESRRQSDRANFIKCCRNYNNGVFLGTYDSDVAWAADKVTETQTHVVATEPPGLAVSFTPGHTPSYMSGPECCGFENGLTHEYDQDSSKRPASIDQLLIEAAIRKVPLQAYNILHVGTGSPALAIGLSALCRHVTGVTPREESGRPTAVGLAPRNYHGVSCNKYSQVFRKKLPLDAYDIIVDNNIASYACCQYHLNKLMEDYSSLLGPTGWLVTTQQGMECSASSKYWRLSEADLACLGGDVGLCVAKTAYGVYTLRKRQEPGHSGILSG